MYGTQTWGQYIMCICENPSPSHIVGQEDVLVIMASETMCWRSCICMTGDWKMQIDHSFDLRIEKFNPSKNLKSHKKDIHTLVFPDGLAKMIKSPNVKDCIIYNHHIINCGYQ
jgi:hypothetical protein